MQDNRHWIAIAGVILLVVGFLWWRGRTAAPESPITDEDIELEERVNRFLEDRGITLPEGVERVNLRDETGEGYAGVATRSLEVNGSQLTLIADLPDLDEGWYEAWLRGEDEDYRSLGRLRESKGGYIIDQLSTLDADEYRWIVISRETASVSEPTDVVLRGEFPVVDSDDEASEEESEDES